MSGHNLAPGGRKEGPGMNGVRTVAVVGGGLASTVAALELAEAGIDVTVFQSSCGPHVRGFLLVRGQDPLGLRLRAGRHPRDRRPDGGGGTQLPRHHRPLYVPSQILDEATSSPFDYAVPRDSMVPVDAIRAHFAAVDQLLQAQQAVISWSAGGPSWREMDRRALSDRFDDERVVAAMETVEVAVDPHVIAPWLRRAVGSHPHIEVRTGTPVRAIGQSAIGAHRARASITADGGTEYFDRAINASWHQRLALDAASRWRTDRPVLHRRSSACTGRGYRRQCRA